MAFEFGERLTALNLPRITNVAAGTLAAPTPEFLQGLMAFPTASGKPVTHLTAIRVGTVLACAKAIANDIAKMPLITRETSIVDGRQHTVPALKNPLYSLLKDAPNQWQTSYQLRWFLASQLVLAGRCFCQKITNQKGDVIALIPLNAWDMRFQWDFDAPLTNDNGDIITTIDRKTGRKSPVPSWHYYAGSQTRVFYQPDLWHTTAHNLEGLGLEGMSLVTLGREAISLLMAAEEFAGRNFANGLGMSGFISVADGVKMTEDQAQKVIDRLDRSFSGSQNAGKFTMLPGGASFQKMSFNPQESQLLDSRKFSEADIARLFGGGPLIVKMGLGQENSTYASSAAFLGDYFHQVLLPYTVSLEQTITRDLIPEADRGKVHAKHDPDVVLYGSPDERTKVYAERILSFQMTPNEAREKEGLPGLAGGDFLAGGTGTPTIMYPPSVAPEERGEFFLAGQLVPQAVMDHQADQADKNAQANADRLAAATKTGGNNGNQGDNNPPNPPPAPNKAKALAERLLNSSVGRILRKEEKSGPSAKFVIEVLGVSEEAAGKYVAQRPSLSEEQARAALITLATEE